MRRLKILILMLYTVILVYLIFQAYKAWQTPLLTIYLTLIGLWIAGVAALSRLYDWLFHEDTEGKRKQKENSQRERDKERIYNWLYNETKDSQEISIGGYTNINGKIIDILIDPRWRSTVEIASSNNLTVERVRELCHTHTGIALMTEKYVLPNQPLEEKWAIKKLIDNS